MVPLQSPSLYNFSERVLVSRPFTVAPLLGSDRLYVGTGSVQSDRSLGRVHTPGVRRRSPE